MIRKIKNWNKMMLFILKHRKKGTASFRLLSTNDEIILVAHIGEDNSEQIRMNY